MSTQLNPHPSDQSTQDRSSDSELTFLRTPVKQKWESPELRILPLEDTEGGFFYAPSENTQLNAQPVPS